MKLSDKSTYYFSPRSANPNKFDLMQIRYPNGIVVKYVYDTAYKPRLVYNNIGYGYVVEWGSGSYANVISSVSVYRDFTSNCNLLTFVCSGASIDRTSYLYVLVPTEVGAPIPMLDTSTREGASAEQYSYDSYREQSNGYWYSLYGTLPRFHRLISYSVGGIAGPYQATYVVGSFPGTAMVSSLSLRDNNTVSMEYGAVGAVTPGVRSVILRRNGTTVTTYELTTKIGNQIHPTMELFSKQTDALGSQSFLYDADFRLWRQQDAEGAITEFEYDAHNNPILARFLPKPNSGSSIYEERATFVVDCMSAAGCFEETSTTDRRNAVKTFVYDPTHGALSRETSPLPTTGAIAPARQLSYVQRYARINSGGGLIDAASPVWLVSSEKRCKTSALAADGSCGAGSTDLVEILYEYGSNSVANYLQLRGVETRSGSESTRTCYQWDERGRLISQSQPIANLGACP